MFNGIDNGKYDGDWKNDMKNGKGKFAIVLGIMHYPNGDYWDGDWKNDVRGTKGKL